MGSGAVQFVVTASIPSGEHRFPVVDPSSHGIVAIDHAEYYIHKGNHFFVGGYGTFAADEDIDFQVTTPNSSVLTHMSWELSSSAASTLKVYEDATVAADGVSVTPINNNRNSLTTSTLTIQTDGTVNAAGTLIYSGAFGSGAGPKAESGFNNPGFELVLAADTTYRFFLESDAAGNIISYSGFWSEYEDVE